ncbi:MAG: S8 family serine peptidase [Acidobacteriota bacterium]
MRALSTMPAVVLFLLAQHGFGLSTVRVTAADAPAATSRLLQQLARTSEPLPVIVGLRDGTPTGRELLLRPDPAGEKGRQIQRIEAQQTLADQMPATQFAPRHFYESFSLISGTASREGIVALARRPDVAWVTFDGKKRALQSSPQDAQVLIRSNSANALGFSGAGASIAVIDTGVDYTVSQLGGGSFPNAKVIGGTDFADGDSDPADCEGHGTSVSAIAAGSTGVAPGAKIVAIKVFSSKGKCDLANDSDILAGINYAITNQARFGIIAINLSLGGEYDDTLDHGFCDSDNPDYAAAFDNAKAAGIVVAAASGNGARSNQIAQPACVTSATSVGAVYSSAFSRVRWSDPDGCTDSPVSPDQVVCFSDSNTNLSILAPGAFWNVVTKGGGFDANFAGTSASTPAFAGAIAVLHQARPDLGPAGLVSLLRATGKPVTDTRNGIVTPRVDVLAAVQQAVAKVSTYSGPVVSIPDGTGSATATVTTSGFTGTLGTVQAWVEIDHAAPQQLRVTLTGPDGTVVLLSDQTGTSEHPINAFYGKTDAAAQSLDRFNGKPGNGVWTLRVEDLVTGTTGRIRNFAIQLVNALAPCAPGPSTLCLNASRFQVNLAWQVPSQGTSGQGAAVPLTADTGYFWFFSANNIELVLKVVDGRPLNGKFWVFYGALTDVQYTVTVLDTLTGNQKTYFSPQGTPVSQADTNAF